VRDSFARATAKPERAIAPRQCSGRDGALPMGAAVQSAPRRAARDRGRLCRELDASADLDRAENRQSTAFALPLLYGLDFLSRSGRGEKLIMD
jgi:hypothetical protein